MDRKWRTNRRALDTVLSYPAFRDLVTPWKNTYNLSTLTDLYSVYTVLHIESKEWEVRWCEEGQFYYFLAKQTIAQPGAAQQAAAPEGDEDMPEPIAESELGDGDQGGNSVPNILEQVQAAEFSGDEEPSERDGMNDSAPPDAPGNVPTGSASGGAPTIRTQLVVPISSAYTDLTPELLQRLFLVRGVQVQQMILGLVDSNGVVTKCCLFNYIQAPLEGPGTANLELLDD